MPQLRGNEPILGLNKEKDKRCKIILMAFKKWH
jgi:hypothetical protein